MEKNELSKEEKQKLRAFIGEMRDHAKQEPEKNGCYEAWGDAWQSWYDKAHNIEDKYMDVIIKALLYKYGEYEKGAIYQSPAVVAEDLQELFRPIKPQLPEESRTLFQHTYIENITSTLTDVLYALTMEQFKARSDPRDDVTKMNIKGIEVSIEHVETFTGGLNSVLKLFDTITGYLTLYNPNKAKKGIRTSIEIPLEEYASARGIQIFPEKMETDAEQEIENQRARNRKSSFKKTIKRDLNNLSRFKITGTVTRGPRKYDYENLVLIYPDHSIKNDIIKVNIPDETAKLLLNSYNTFYCTILQKVNDSNPNTYRIGRGMNIHYCIDNNVSKGTNGTLKVKSLVSLAPKIKNLSELPNISRWKDKIKDPLEKVLNNLKEVGFLVSWNYRQSATNKIYDSSEISKLTASEYWDLNVDYVLQDNPKQQERITKKREKKKLKADAEKEEKSQNV